MEKRYQIFISSTFSDLKKERMLVSETILDMGHFPAGMELFPATDASQMTYIQKVIDTSDYYVLIIGGRYGSTDETGLSFTEQEYDYASKKKVPILAFIHEDIGEIKSSNVDQGSLAQKLENFKERVSSSRLIKYWKNKDELARLVMSSLNSEFAETPRDGWQRGTNEPSQASLLKINGLQEKADLYLKRWTDAQDKLTKYESLENLEIELNYTTNADTDGIIAKSFVATSEQLVRHFASTLSQGFERKDIESILIELIRHKIDQDVDTVTQGTRDNVLLFFQVYEIIEEDPLALKEWFLMRDEKKYLLKSVFKKNEEMNTDFYDEIPF